MSDILNRFFHHMADKYSLVNIVEMPALGEKAMPSLYSLAFAEVDCDATLGKGVDKSQWA